MTRFDYDELNRRVATRILGLDGVNGTSIDHVSRVAYDSRGNVRLSEMLLVEQVVEHDHQQGDHKPECQVFVERIQMSVPPGLY